MDTEYGKCNMSATSFDWAVFQEIKLFCVPSLFILEAVRVFNRQLSFSSTYTEQHSFKIKSKG